YVSADTVYGAIKGFRVPHPDQPGKDITYTCLEGPEVAMYVRGKGQLNHGRAIITLPDHFVTLADPEGMTAQVTPMTTRSLGLAVTSASLTGVIVEELQGGAGSYSFYYEIKAIRKAYKDWQIVRDSD